jgi:hypothetical protein
MLPKENVFSITSSSNIQIFKNYVAREVAVSGVQTKLHGSVSRLRQIWLNLA